MLTRWRWPALMPMGKRSRAAGLEPDLGHDLVDLLGNLPTAALAVDLQGQGDGPADRQVGRQAVEGVLQQQLEALAHRQELGLAHGCNVLALEADPSLVRLLDPAQQPGKRGLATAGFADEAEVLAPVHVERDATHRLDRLGAEEPRAVGDDVGLGDVLDGEDDGWVGSCLDRWRWCAPDDRIAVDQVTAIGMLGCLQQPGGRAALDDPALGQHDQLVGDVARPRAARSR